MPNIDDMGYDDLIEYILNLKNELSKLRMTITQADYELKARLLSDGKINLLKINYDRVKNHNTW